MSNPALQVFPPVDHHSVLRPQTIEELLLSPKKNQTPAPRKPWLVPLIIGIAVAVVMLSILLLHHSGVHSTFTRNQVASSLLADYHWKGFYRVPYLIVTS